MSCDSIKSIYKHKKEKFSAKTKQKYSVCLICGRQGCHDIFITNFTNHLSSSGTQLAKFITKIIGEEPCYSISQLICQQCYLLLDRLDTYQSRAAEISDYISSRYKETKLELVGNRQRISELIVSSLSNIRSFKNGTTLNVCDELSVTVFHDSLLRREPKSQNSTLANNILKSGNANRCTNLNNIANNSIKLKRKRTSSNSQNLIKKQKWTTLNNNNNNVNNSNKNIINNLIEDNKSNYDNELISESPLLNSVQKIGDLSESESEGSAKEECIGSDGGNNNSNSSELKRLKCSNGKSSSNTSSSSSDKSSSSSSSDSSSSSESNTTSISSDDSSDDDDNVDAVKTENVPNEKTEEIKSIEEPNLPCEIKQEIILEEDLEMPKQDMRNFNGKEEIGAIESHLAEAVLTQGSFASNLFESFLSTSLWMNNTPDSASQKSFASLTKQQQKQNQTLQAQCLDDDMTVESLSAAAISINDKKKRLELKNTGQSYINTKGKLIEAKRVWPQDCSRCLLKCNNRLSEETRLVIFSDYWGLGDYDLQREYLAQHMEREERVGPSGLSRTVVLYFLTYDKQRYQVCRQFFLKTLDVSEKASRIVLEKKLKGELGVKVPEAPAEATAEINNSDEVST